MPRKILIIAGIVLVAIAVILLILPPLLEYQTMSFYEQTMSNLDRPIVLDAIKANITSYFGNVNRTYSLNDLFKWESTCMTFVKGSLTKRPTDPKDILASGLGKCQEFSILYAAACLSVGYNASLNIVVNKNWYADTEHAFNEVQYQNGSWVQIDVSWNTPTLLVFNNTTVYKDSYWWSRVGSTYQIIAFYYNGKHKDVTYQNVS